MCENRGSHCFSIRQSVWRILDDQKIVANENCRYLAVDMFTDSVLKFIRTCQNLGDIDVHLNEIRESSDVMMQRDPEIMKQKRMAAQAPEAGETMQTALRGQAIRELRNLAPED